MDQNNSSSVPVCADSDVLNQVLEASNIALDDSDVAWDLEQALQVGTPFSQLDPERVSTLLVTRTYPLSYLVSTSGGLRQMSETMWREMMSQDEKMVVDKNFFIKTRAYLRSKMIPALCYDAAIMSSTRDWDNVPTSVNEIVCAVCTKDREYVNNNIKHFPQWIVDEAKAKIDKLNKGLETSVEQAAKNRLASQRKIKSWRRMCVAKVAFVDSSHQVNLEETAEVCIIDPTQQDQLQEGYLYQIRGFSVEKTSITRLTSTSSSVINKLGKYLGSTTGITRSYVPLSYLSNLDLHQPLHNEIDVIGVVKDDPTLTNQSGRTFTLEDGQGNSVEVHCWSSVWNRTIECAVRKGNIVAMSNLKWNKHVWKTSKITFMSIFTVVKLQTSTDQRSTSSMQDSLPIISHDYSVVSTEPSPKRSKTSH